MKKKSETLYICDPKKNVTCTKEGCYINGGPCFCTSNKEYAETDKNEDSIEASEDN